MKETSAGVLEGVLTLANGGNLEAKKIWPSCKNEVF